MQTQPTDDDLSERYAAALREIDAMLEAGESSIDEMRKLLVMIASIANAAIS